jgi:hypothetical protein
MADMLILEFDGVGAQEYAAVNQALGIDMETGQGDWPPGLITHTAGLAADGTFVVTEVWASQADQAAFMESRLGRALAEGGINSEPSVRWVPTLAHHHPGG